MENSISLTGYVTQNKIGYNFGEKPTGTIETINSYLYIFVKQKGNLTRLYVDL